MTNSKKYISMAVSLIVLPLAKAALSKIIHRYNEKKEHDLFTKEKKEFMSPHTGRS